MKKKKTISIRVEPEMYTGLKLRAQFDNVSVGELCRTLIKKGLKLWQKEQESEK